MLLFDPQRIGGLEEYTTNLASALRRCGEDVSVLSLTWVPPGNQYVQRLAQAGITVAQPPRTLSRLASDWPTRDRLLAAAMVLVAPVVGVLAIGLVLQRRCSWSQAWTSAYGWLRGKWSACLMRDRRPMLGPWVLARWCRRWRPDLLHIHGYVDTLLFAVDWAYDHGYPIVYEEHQTPDAGYGWWFDHPASINKADLVVAVSETSASALRAVCDVQRPIVVIEPVVPDPKAAGWRAEGPREESDGGMQVTAIGRLIEIKGMRYLLDAIPSITATHPRTRFRIYGEGPLRAELVAHANRLGLDGESLFAAPYTSRDALAAIMSDTDIFAMPSLLEGQPLVLIEAMAYSRPIVATAVGGIPEIIEHGRNGLLCQPRDVECLSDSIRALIVDAPRRARLGDAARQSYLEGPFEAGTAAERLLAAYHWVLEDRRRQPLAEETVGHS
jgi:glycosyltransferase involved in cell wall biosynthesis